MCFNKLAPWTAAQNKAPVIELDYNMIGKEKDSGFRVGQKIIYHDITDFHLIIETYYVMIEAFIYAYMTNN